MAVIETLHLKKYYGRSRGIEDVTFRVEEGEIYGFIGPNGAGKSTTIRTLLNFIFPTAGSAKVFGLDVVTQSEAIRRQVGYLPSEVGYYDDMTVRALLEYAAGFYGGDRRDHRRRLHELADAFELDLRKRVHSLSMGNRKKVGIVLALLHRPKLLILDEPTGSLDPLMQLRLFEVLAEENRSGTTIFFSSHILSEVQRLCHRVAIIKDGRILKVEDMAGLRRSHFQKVRAVFAEDPGVPAAGGLGLAGIVHQAWDGRTLDLLYNGDVNDLVRLLAGHRLESLRIEEPSLEEIFLHYYGKQGRDSGKQGGNGKEAGAR
ncbi:MAG: ABC transporter ATP-binding protein [Firmicutes bacterium]|nr:ABC transporter ATP-binding protein [Bacillota bacterium]